MCMIIWSCFSPYSSVYVLFITTIQDRLRRGERKNRDAFRKLLEEHVAAGILTAKTQWREYCLKVIKLFIGRDEYLEGNNMEVEINFLCFLFCRSETYLNIKLLRQTHLVPLRKIYLRMLLKILKIRLLNFHFKLFLLNTYYEFVIYVYCY